MNPPSADSETSSTPPPAVLSLLVAHDSAINYAFQQNAIPVVKELRFQNDHVARKGLVIYILPVFRAAV